MNKNLLAILGVIALVVVIVAGWSISGYNRVVTMDENVKTAWAQVENQLKRRYDLIPNLVETVKGYASHEKEIFEHLADARTKYFEAQDIKSKIAASGDLEQALSRLLVLQENYPQLKANESFLKMMDTLEGTENRLAVERKRYNDTVRILNTYIRTVAGRYFAGLAGVTKAEYYQVPEAEQAAPKVKF
jgi:LemA protein